ncbi:hypothetical protein ABK040_004509 [Willaertia magna]
MNKIEKQRIKVYVRCRPMSEEEKKIEKATNCVEISGNEISVTRHTYNKRKFIFDEIFSEETSQEAIYNVTSKDAIDDVFNGYHATIFVYGQTSTGKTFTISNNEAPPELQGIIPRSIRDIFRRIQLDNENEYTVKMSYIQIYMETIQDLLMPENKNLQIREDNESGVYIDGVSSKVIANVDEYIKLYTEGDINRVTALTKLNASSSRSHACLIVNIEKRKKIENNNVETLEDRKVTRANLYLVDLAGSERLKKTEAEGIRKKEANYINLSLTTLGIVIHSLEVNNPHIPYRDSKLTRLLQDSLGGNGKTRIIITVGPCSIHNQETITSLLFGQRAMNVKTQPKVNQAVDYKALSIKLQAQLEELETKYSTLEGDLLGLVEENERLGTNLNILTTENTEMKRKIRTFEVEGAKEKEKLISLMKGDLVEVENQHRKIVEELSSKLENLTDEYEERILRQETMYNEILKDKEAEIESIEEEMTEKRKDFEITVDQLQMEISNLRKELETTQLFNEQLERDLAQTTSELESLQNLVESNKENESLIVSRLSKELKVQTKVVNNLQEKFKKDLIFSIINDEINQKLKKENSQLNDVLRNLYNEIRSIAEKRTVTYLDTSVMLSCEAFGQKLHSSLDDKSLLNPRLLNYLSHNDLNSEEEKADEISEEKLYYIISTLDCCNLSVSKEELENKEEVEKIVNNCIEESEKQVGSIEKSLKVNELWEQISESTQNIMLNYKENHRVVNKDLVFPKEGYLNDYLNHLNNGKDIPVFNLDELPRSHTVDELFSQAKGLLNQLEKKWTSEFTSLSLYSKWLSMTHNYFDIISSFETIYHEQSIYLKKELKLLTQIIDHFIQLAKSNERDKIIYKSALETCASQLYNSESTNKQLKSDLEILQDEQKRTLAAITIQQFIKRNKRKSLEESLRQEQLQLALQTQTHLQRIKELQKSELNYKATIGKQTADTGKMLLKQSYNDIEYIFYILKAYFLYGDDDEHNHFVQTSSSERKRAWSNGSRTAYVNSVKEDFGGSKISLNKHAAAKAFNNCFSEEDLSAINSIVSNDNQNSKITTTSSSTGTSPQSYRMSRVLSSKNFNDSK